MVPLPRYPGLFMPEYSINTIFIDKDMFFLVVKGIPAGNKFLLQFSLSR